MFPELGAVDAAEFDGMDIIAGEIPDHAGHNDVVVPINGNCRYLVITMSCVVVVGSPDKRTAGTEFYHPVVIIHAAGIMISGDYDVAVVVNGHRFCFLFPGLGITNREPGQGIATFGKSRHCKEKQRCTHEQNNAPTSLD